MACLDLFSCLWPYLHLHLLFTHADEYFFTRLPIVEKRLAQGGVRLAAALNRIFTLQHPLQLRSESR